MEHFRKKMKKVDPNYFSILSGVYFLHFFLKMLQSKSRFFRGALGAKFLKKKFMSKTYSKNMAFHENSFLIGVSDKKLWPLKVAYVRVLISHWLRNLAEIFFQFHNSQPFSFPKWYDNRKLGQN